MTIQRILFSFSFLILVFQSPAGTAQRKVEQREWGQIFRYSKSGGDQGEVS